MKMASQNAYSSPDMDPSARMRLLIDSSHKVEVDPNIPIARYFKSGRELIKTAAASLESGDIEKSFVLYLRYMSLFLEKLVHHPEWTKVDHEEKKSVKNECNKIFDTAEKLKAQIKEKYEEEYKRAKLVAPGVSDKNTNETKNANIDSGEIERKFSFSNETTPSETVKVLEPFDIDQLRMSLRSEKN